MQSEIKFYGVNETLFYLKNYEKELFEEFQKKLVDASKELTDVVGKGFPTQTPLSNWKTSGSRVGKARMPPFRAKPSTIKAISGGQKKKTAKGGYGILRIQQNDAGGSVYDGIGRGTYETLGSTFIDNIDKKEIGKVVKRMAGRSRYMFKAVKDNEHLIEVAVLKVVKEVDGYTTRRINESNTR